MIGVAIRCVVALVLSHCHDMSSYALAGDDGMIIHRFSRREQMITPPHSPRRTTLPASRTPRNGTESHTVPATLAPSSGISIVRCYMEESMGTPVIRRTRTASCACFMSALRCLSWLSKLEAWARLEPPG